MFKRLVSGALIFGAAALAPPVSAQAIQCFSRDLLIDKLTEDYKEQLQGGGLRNSQQLLEVWSSPETGSFTVFVTDTTGRSCVLATGKNWNSHTQALAKDGIPG